MSTLRGQLPFEETLYLYRRIAEIGIDWVRDELGCLDTLDPDVLSEALSLFETHPSSEDKAVSLLHDSIQQALGLLDSDWHAVLETASEVHSQWLRREARREMAT